MMSERWRAAFVVVGAYLAVSVAGCADSDVTTGNAPDELKAVVLPFLSASPFYIAAEEGFFEEQNLEVEFVRLPRAVEAIPALARGEVDVSAGQLTLTVLNAMTSGVRIQLVAGTAFDSPDGCTNNGLLARRELVESGRLSGPEDLVGLKVELDVLLPSAFAVDRLLQSAGLGIDDLEVVNLPAPAHVDAVAAGTIDLAVATEPYLTRMSREGKAVVWMGTEEIVPDYQLSSVMFGPSLLDDRPDVGERFMVAFRKAMRQYEQGKTPRNLEILSEATGLSVEELNGMCWPTFREDGRVGTDGFIEYQEWLRSRELIDRVLPAEDLVDERFVEHANAVVDP
jgi:NitT/TauT family transport system substrate-binding protein